MEENKFSLAKSCIKTNFPSILFDNDNEEEEENQPEMLPPPSNDNNNNNNNSDTGKNPLPLGVEKTTFFNLQTIPDLPLILTRYISDDSDN